MSTRQVRRGGEETISGTGNQRGTPRKKKPKQPPVSYGSSSSEELGSPISSSSARYLHTPCPERGERPGGVRRCCSQNEPNDRRAGWCRMCDRTREQLSAAPPVPCRATGTAIKTWEPAQRVAKVQLGE